MAWDIADRDGWTVAISAVRARTLRLAAPLSAEDLQSQAMPDASPGKWHLAHTTWFFDEFLLSPAGLAPERPASAQFLFNSYYETIGDRQPRPERGLITRPGVDEIIAWRKRVDVALERYVREADTATFSKTAALIELGLAHEEQHQELFLMDILSLLTKHPDSPAYRTDLASASGPAQRPARWIEHGGGLVETGGTGEGFAFDNELPRHKSWLEPFALADRLVTNGEWAEFIADGGYESPTLWLAEGWDTVRAQGWTAPEYWRDGGQATLAGLEAIDPAAPVQHVSLYEADAYARWAGARLPTEAEWETVAAGRPTTGNFMETDVLRPRPADDGDQMFGDLWEWTASAYSPYPGFRPAVGALGEYNGKFMARQFVLRGGCCATPAPHIRAAYRNFYHPHQRWMFSGLRLAKDIA
ncbi:MAG: ergothioneine biosynthesis protein EgtB [Pseudomonadota bacterium]